MALSWSGRRQVLYTGVAAVVAATVLIWGYETFLVRAPSCFNGVQDGDETGVDCGGSCALICADQAHAPLVLWARSFNVGGNYYTAAAYVQNNNPGAGSKLVHYSFQLFDANNVLVIEKDGAAELPPVQTIPIIEPNIDVGNRVVAKTLFAFIDVPVWERVAANAYPQLTTTQQNLTSDASRLSATIVNNTLNNAKNVTLTAVLFDADGVARAASKSLIASIPAQSSEPAVFTWPGGVPNIVRGEISILPSF